MFSIILPPDMVFLGISIFAHISFLAVSVYMPAHCLSNEQKATRKMRVVLMHRPHAPFIFLVRRCQCPVSAPPPFVVCRQLPIALTLRHPSALIAIVLRSNKLQIALTNQPNNQPNNNIYERYMSAKNHISFFLSQSRFSSALSYYQSASPINRTVQKKRKNKCGCALPKSENF